MRHSLEPWTCLGPGTIVGYCANVHPAPGGEAGAEHLAVATDVCHRVSPDRPLGVGLWWPDTAVEALREITGQAKPSGLAALLETNRLAAFSFNGFPQKNFHAPVVKERVYEPDWSDPARAAYTLDLARLLAETLEPGEEGSISTLPIGGPRFDHARADAAAAALRDVARDLHRIEQETGRLIHLDLEPEPGCVLQTHRDVVRWFGERLIAGGAEPDMHRHIRVCHDVCHAAVMYEDQASIVDAYDRAGILIGKVQVSNALRALFNESGQERQTAAALRRFDEPRWLHQTHVRVGNDQRLFLDLKDAFTATDPPRGEWRVHFHVPIYLDRIGPLLTTQDAIVEAVRLLRGRVRHWEVETYAWSALPPELQVDPLAEGIARELKWFADLCARETRAGT